MIVSGECTVSLPFVLTLMGSGQCVAGQYVASQYVAG